MLHADTGDFNVPLLLTNVGNYNAFVLGEYFCRPPHAAAGTKIFGGQQMIMPLFLLKPYIGEGIFQRFIKL